MRIKDSLKPFYVTLGGNMNCTRHVIERFVAKSQEIIDKATLEILNLVKSNPSFLIDERVYVPVQQKGIFVLSKNKEHVITFIEQKNITQPALKRIYYRK